MEREKPKEIFGSTYLGVGTTDWRFLEDFFRRRGIEYILLFKGRDIKLELPGYKTGVPDFYMTAIKIIKETRDALKKNKYFMTKETICWFSDLTAQPVYDGLLEQIKTVEKAIELERVKNHTKHGSEIEALAGEGVMGDTT